MKETQGLVIIIDALNLFTRHFISHPAVNSNGQHAGGVVGFLYAIISFAEMYSPDQVIVVWEGGGSSRRRAIYSDYKQRRKPEKLNRFYEDDIPNTVENRNSQISLIVEILKKLPVCQIYVEDCEADDVIGYISKYKFLNNRKMIVSSDRDFYQLLDKNTIIYSPTWKKLVTSIEVRDKFGISPDNFCLAKSICGDVSDNIKGVPGVGFKTVAKRFPEMKENNTVTIQDIIDASRERIKDGSKIKIYQRIVDSESLIRNSDIQC